MLPALAHNADASTNTAMAASGACGGTGGNAAKSIVAVILGVRDALTESIIQTIPANTTTWID
jgi:hypothetical protein